MKPNKRIDKLLGDAGWDPADKRQVGTEVATTLSSLVNEVESIASSMLTDEPLTSSAPKKADDIHSRPIASPERSGRLEFSSDTRPESRH